MLNRFCLLNDKTHPPASFNKSLYVGTYVYGKIAGCKKIFYRPNHYITVRMKF